VPKATSLLLKALAEWIAAQLEPRAAAAARAIIASELRALLLDQSPLAAAAADAAAAAADASAAAPGRRPGSGERLSICRSGHRCCFICTSSLPWDKCILCIGRWRTPMIYRREERDIHEICGKLFKGVAKQCLTGMSWLMHSGALGKPEGNTGQPDGHGAGGAVSKSS